MDGRMTVCNMTIEGGARAGMIAPDETTFAYLEGRPFVPRGKAFQEAVERWKQLRSEDGAKFDMTVELHAEQIAPQVTWGTNPGMVTSVTARVRIRTTSRIPTIKRPRRARSSTWASNPARPSWIFPWTASSSVRAQFAPR